MQISSCNKAHTLFIETGCRFMNFSDKSNLVKKLSIFFDQEFMKPKYTKLDRPHCCTILCTYSSLAH